MQEAAAEMPSGLTRGQVAAQLGISTSSVRRLEWDRLHPVQDQRGVWRFDPQEVASIAPKQERAVREVPAHAAERRALKRRGQLAARVFLMFSRSRSLAEIVVATKQPPEVIRELYREWSMSLEEVEWDRRDRAAR